jgi:hypothetical protein
MNRTLLVPIELAEPRTSVSRLAFSKVADVFRSVLVAIVLAPAMIAATEVELRWDELSPMITGKEVALVLPNGAALRGEAVAVRDEGLVMVVKRTSDRRLQPKGQATIPREQVKLLELRRPRGAAGRIAMTIVGAFGGLTLGALLAYTATDGAAAAWATFVGIGTGGAVLGYYAGDEIDRRTTRIKIVEIPTVTTRPIEK